MIPFGKILKFKSYDGAKLARMREDLALQAPLSLWQYCKEYYGSRAKRDPYIEELKLLDRIFLSLQERPDLLSVRELYTNDAFVARTYGDMMQKRRELSDESRAPISIGSLFTLANNYLQMIGKDDRELPLLLWETQDKLRRIPTCDRTPKSSDLFAILLPHPLSILKKEEQEEQVANELLLDAEEAPLAEPMPQPDLDGLFENLEFTSQIRDLQSMGSQGLLTTLLQKNTAFKIDLTALCDRENPCFASVLTSDFEGALLIRIPHGKEETASSLAGAHGYLLKTVAYADEGGSMTLLLEGRELLTLETSFLKSLFEEKVLCAKLRNEKDGALACQRIKLLPYQSGVCGTQVTCTVRNAFFTNALFSALSAVILQSLRGTSYREQQLAVSLQIPKAIDDRIGGDLLSTLIGLYRLQAELGILMTARIFPDNDATELTLTAISLGKNLSADPEDAEKALRELEIPKDENGLPRFDELRQQLQALALQSSSEEAQIRHFEETEPQKKDNI